MPICVYEWIFSSAPSLITGPTSVSSSQPTPSRSCSAAETRRDASASYAPSWTITRDAAVQRWPEVPNADQRIPSTARSRSASSRTMIAFLPPSSRWMCLRHSAALRITCTPVSREPVSVITGTSGWRTSRSPTAAPPAAFAGHVVAPVDRLLDVSPGLGLDLPHLVRHQLSELGLVVGHELSEAEENLAAPGRRHEPPLLESLLRDGERAIGVLGARFREDAERLAVRRAGRLERLARDGIDPLAADEVLERALARDRHERDVSRAPRSPGRCLGCGRGGGRGPSGSRRRTSPSGGPAPRGGRESR